jgi:hypothetical protein
MRFLHGRDDVRRRAARAAAHEARAGHDRVGDARREVEQQLARAAASRGAAGAARDKGPDVDDAILAARDEGGQRRVDVEREDRARVRGDFNLERRARRRRRRCARAARGGAEDADAPVRVAGDDERAANADGRRGDARRGGAARGESVAREERARCAVPLRDDARVVRRDEEPESRRNKFTKERRWVWGKEVRARIRDIH